MFRSVFKKGKLDICDDKVHENDAYSKQSQVIKYKRQKEFHIPEQGKGFVIMRSSVYTVLDQVVHQLQPITASQTG